MHCQDLPVFGFGKDRTIGLGLWMWSALAFVIELVFYVVLTLIFVPARIRIPPLILLFVFHLVNANSFLGFSRKNPFPSARAYALGVLVAFLGFIIMASAISNGLLWD
ncbi:MAG: hypothetical protein LUQ13_02695 [Methanomicrobiales archaeon]|nr:hypothetical protein [Methanomicrobiales archaeon]